MIKKIFSLSTISCLLISIISITAFSQVNKHIDLKDIYNRTHSQGRQVKSYVVPSSKALTEFNRLFCEFAKNVFSGNTAKSRSLANSFKTLGFEITEITKNSDRFFILTEIVVKGGGFYALREKPSSSLVIMAPHTFFDVGTGDIALNSFLSTQAFILMTNTIHRYSSLPSYFANKENKNSSKEKILDNYEFDSINADSDLAHNETNFFFCAFKAILQTLDKTIIVQLHGFNNKKDGRDNSAFDMIISPGKAITPKDIIAKEVYLSLKKDLLPFKVGLYGEDASFLGGTTNIHANFLNSKFPKVQFLHLEMSQQLRQKLVSDQNLSLKFITILKKL